MKAKVIGSVVMASWYPGQKAQEIADRAKSRYEESLASLKTLETETNQIAQEYGEFQLNIIVNTLKPVIDYMISIGKKVSEKERQLLDRYDFSAKKLAEYQAVTIKAENLLMGGVQASVAGAAAYGGAFTLATSIGVASTGTAISTLSGAAAWNATLAWFGGGAIAAGGGGMALGAWVLGGITVLPALGIGVWMAKSQGEKALTKAKEYEAQVNQAIAEMNTAIEATRQISKRIEELKGALNSLSNHTLNNLKQLKKKAWLNQSIKMLLGAMKLGNKTGKIIPPFSLAKKSQENSNIDVKLLQELMLFTQAIVKFLETPVLNEEGKLNHETFTILEKYRAYSSPK